MEGSERLGDKIVSNSTQSKLRSYPWLSTTYETAKESDEGRDGSLYGSLQEDE